MARIDELIVGSKVGPEIELAWTGERETILGKITVGSSPAGYPGINVSQIGKREPPIGALSWQREVVHRSRAAMDNLALNDQGATLLIQGTTPLRKSTNSIRWRFSYSTSSGQRTSTRKIDSVIR